MIPVNYIELNKDSWNKRTEAHLKSKFYAMDKFLAGESSLNDIELSYLGDVTGKKSFTSNVILVKTPFRWRAWALL